MNKSKGKIKSMYRCYWRLSHNIYWNTVDMMLYKKSIGTIIEVSRFLHLTDPMVTN